MRISRNRLRAHVGNELKSVKGLRNNSLKWAVILVVAICLMSAITLGIPNTIAKNESFKEAKFRRSNNPIMNLLIDEEKRLPIVPPEPVGRSLDEDAEQAMEMVVYDVKTKETKNFTKSDKISLKMPGSQGSLPSELMRANPIGYGDRVRVTPTTAYPWRTIVKLRMLFPNGERCSGSGFIIDDYHVLTAGHCVYNSSKGGRVETVEVIPALDDGYSPFYHAWSTKITVDDDWIEHGWKRWDFAIITLDRNIGAFTGWMGLEYASTRDPIYTGILHTAGYPGDLGGGENMYWDSDYGENAYFYYHRYWLDVRGGQSGSPVWYYDDLDPYVLSIATYSNLPEFSNRGTRLRGLWFELIERVRASDTPPTDYANLIDDGQLSSGFSTTHVAPGKTPFNVWSGIKNIGTAESGEFRVSYYASTDRIISGYDYLIGRVTVPSITPFSTYDSVWSGTFPSDIPDGTYWVGWTIDTYNVVPEPLDEGEDNNRAYHSYQLTVESYPLINYYTNPSDVGSIIFNDVTYVDGHSGNYLPGDYTITASINTGYDFHHWEYDNIGTPGEGVYVQNMMINPSTASVSGEGWLKAVFEALIIFRTDPSYSGSISYDGTIYSEGDFIGEVRLPPDYTNIMSITANPSDDYTFSHWEPTGQIGVASTTSITTDLTVNGPGVLTAVLESARAREIPLYEGWNLISLPLTPEDPSIEVVLADILDDVRVVWTFDETGAWSSYAPGAPSNLEEMVDDRGYWILMTEDAWLTVRGESAITGELALFEGWSLIGLPLTPEDPTIEVVLADILDDVYCVWAFDGETKTWLSYVPGFPSALSEMVGEKGYYIKMKEDATLTVHG